MPSAAWSPSISLRQLWSMARGRTQLPSCTQEAGTDGGWGGIHRHSIRVYIFDVTNTHTYYYSEIGYMHNMHTHLNYRFIRSLTAECARRLTLKEIKSPCGMSHPISPPVKMLLFPLVPVTFSSGYLGLCGAERHQRGNLARRPRVDEASP